MTIKHLLTYAAIFSKLVSHVNAQNLVPNFSFEEVIKEPCNIVGLERLSTYFFDWETPTIGSSDGWYYNPIINNCVNNTINYNVQPHSGTHCIGLLTGTLLPETILNAVNTTEYREYAQVKLNHKLIIGKNYYAEMYVLPLNISEVFTNNLGICFTTDRIQQYTRIDGNPFTGLLTCKPQINEKSVLASPNKWVKVSVCFKANEEYAYLTIGNFFSNQNTLFVINKNFTPRPNLSRISCYYLIDDILVRESSLNELPRAFGRNIDTTLCNGIPLTVRPTPSDSTLLTWENGYTNPVRTIQQPGTYLITASRGECSVTDTLRVQREVNPVLPPDTTLCQGELLHISVSHPLKKYLWSTGAIDSSIVVNTSGTYRVQIPSAHCQLTGDIKITYVDCPGSEPIPNTITPNGDGKNDFFYIKNVELTPWKFSVYNRWGKQVYAAAAYHNEWDGGNLPGGVYFYLLESKALNRRLKGTVLILRQAE